MTGFTLPCGSKIRKDIANQRFGRLVVVRCVGCIKTRGAIWECTCDCGKTTVVRGDMLRGGNTTSCGCLADKSNLTHGESYNELYPTWIAMKSRCENPKNKCYQNYGGRGIKICKRWSDSVEAFIEDVGTRPTDKHSIDRIDSNGDYCPENCRWATPKEQQNNRRNNKRVTFNGETHSVAEWAEKIGIRQLTLGRRLRLGWTIEKALTEPIDVLQQRRSKSHPK